MNRKIKNIKLLLMIVIFYIIFLNINSVSATITPGTGGAGSATMHGDGSWYAGCVGLKVSIYNLTSKSVKQTKIFKGTGSCNITYYSNSINPKFIETDYNWTKTKPAIETYNALPSSYEKEDKIINFKNELEKNSYELLKGILSNFNNLENDDLIIIEPMVNIEGVFATLYEISALYVENENTNLPCNERFNCWYGAVLVKIARSLYTTNGFGGPINPVQNSFLQGGEEILKAERDRVVKGYIKPKNGGGGVGVYKYSDIIEPPVQNTCTDLFKNDKKTRLNLYKNRFPDYNGLLNFSGAQTASEACKSITYNTKYNSKCLSGTINKDYENFNSDNLSNYTKKIDASGNIAFCSTKIEMNNLLKTDSFKAKSGMIYEPYAVNFGVVEANLSVKCYAFDLNGNLLNTSISLGKFSDYLSDLKLGEKSLKLYDFKYANEKVIVNSNEEKVFTIQYVLPNIYIKKGTGEISTTDCDSCIYAGTGIISNLNAKGTEKMLFSYKSRLSGEGNYNLITSTNDNACNFTATPELIENGKLNLEFRQIDVNKPFPGKVGKNREKSSIWRISSIESLLDINSDGKFNSLDYLELSKNNFNDIDIYGPYDLNQNGSIDSSDKETLNTYANKNEDVYAENLLNSRPNSYGIMPYTNRSIEPKYIINLTPKVINEIKKYKKNSNINYDEFNYDCLQGLKNADANLDSEINEIDVKRIFNSTNLSAVPNYLSISTLPGDVNVDGVINNKDVVKISKYINGYTDFCYNKNLRSLYKIIDINIK